MSETGTRVQMDVQFSVTATGFFMVIASHNLYQRSDLATFLATSPKACFCKTLSVFRPYDSAVCPHSIAAFGDTIADFVPLKRPFRGCQSYTIFFIFGYNSGCFCLSDNLARLCLKLSVNSSSCTALSLHFMVTFGYRNDVFHFGISMLPTSSILTNICEQWFSL